jgi:hypothetical protein
MRRFSSNGVPSNRSAGGKKSVMEGPWNPPSSLEAAVTIRDATWMDSVGSGFGAPMVGASMGQRRVRRQAQDTTRAVTSVIAVD